VAESVVVIVLSQVVVQYIADHLPADPLAVATGRLAATLHGGAPVARGCHVEHTVGPESSAATSNVGKSKAAPARRNSDQFNGR
jgi:hypothetical protein